MVIFLPLSSTRKKNNKQNHNQSKDKGKNPSINGRNKMSIEEIIEEESKGSIEKKKIIKNSLINPLYFPLK